MNTSRARLALLPCVWVALFFAGAAALFAAETLTRKGNFTRGNDKNKPTELKATLTSTGAGTWSVVFTCPWKNKEETFRGTAKGNLTSGEVSGVATNSAGKRTWTFRGTAQNGTLSCKHYETSKGKEQFTGEFVIKP